MGLSWINPLYLSGLLLLALPVLIHLVQKQHSQGMRFPSLMFLKQIPQREKRRLEIRHWLLLVLRCLLLLLIVLAFARPFFNTEGGANGLEPERQDSVIVLDRSYSMLIADHWQQARDQALQLVEQKQARDRIGVIAGYSKNSHPGLNRHACRSRSNRRRACSRLATPAANRFTSSLISRPRRCPRLPGLPRIS
jgi:hypothetical protein